MKRLIIMSSPSGGGKSTIAKHLLDNYNIRFSVSCATRNMREGEIDGVHYYFISKEDFENMIENGGLIEYEKIFDNYYGTRRSDVEKALDNKEALLFDVDVKGALSLKKAFPKDAFLLFIAPPSIEALEKRLRARGTESEEQIAKRLARAEMEMAQSNKFDRVLINDILEESFSAVDLMMSENGFQKKVCN